MWKLQYGVGQLKKSFMIVEKYFGLDLILVNAMNAKIKDSDIFINRSTDLSFSVGKI